jgi:nucleotide-binding universal stress UspA family protein
MFQINKILFPVDFSPRVRGAVAYVEALAGRFDAEIILLHVIEPPAYNDSLSEETGIEAAEFDRFFGADLAYLRVQRLIEYGEAARKIVERAADLSVDLIMMPTQGLGTFRRLILGSTTAKVLHDAECPVWTGVHLEDSPPLDAIYCRKILCAVDLQAASGLVLDWACQLAAEYQAELTLLHVTPENGSARPSRNGREETAAQMAARAKLDELLRAAGARAVIRVDSGQPAKTVVAVAREVASDLVVIGRRVAPGISGRLEANAYAIIRQSPCPVVSV